MVLFARRKIRGKQNACQIEVGNDLLEPLNFARRYAFEIDPRVTHGTQQVGVEVRFNSIKYSVDALQIEQTPGRLLYALAITEHFAGGMATAALFTLMMDVCRPASEGTDYTVQACFVVVSSGAASAISGYVAQGLGYTLHFVLSGVLGLASGRHCLLAQPAAPVCERYYVVFFPDTYGPPTAEEQDEMLMLTRHKAREYAGRWLGDPECYTIIHNGQRTRRARNTHYHILLVRDRWEKASAYLKLFVKNLLQSVDAPAEGLPTAKLPSTGSV